MIFHRTYVKYEVEVNNELHLFTHIRFLHHTRWPSIDPKAIQPIHPQITWFSPFYLSLCSLIPSISYRTVPKHSTWIHPILSQNPLSFPTSRSSPILHESLIHHNPLVVSSRKIMKTSTPESITICITCTLRVLGKSLRSTDFTDLNFLVLTTEVQADTENSKQVSKCQWEPSEEWQWWAKNL